MLTSNKPDTPLFFNRLNTKFNYNSAVIWEITVFVRYSREKNWIAIVGIVPSFSKPNKEACSRKLNDIRLLLRPDGRLGIHDFFRTEFSFAKEEAVFSKNISDNVHIVIELGNLKKKGI